MHHKADTMDSITYDQSPVAELADNNNNQKNEIYSLRQRKQRRTKGGAANNNSGNGPNSTDDNGNNTSGGSNKKSSNKNNTGSGESTTSNTSSVGLRANGASATNNKRGDGKSDKPKPKAAPLSKYRRKTANARERTRMREINCAFEHLRQCVPVSITGVETPSNNEKLTKITTLRLAMKYIRILSEILAKSSNCDGTNSNDPNAINSFNYQDIYNDILNDTLFKPTVTKPSGGRKELKKQNAPPPPPKVKKTNRTRRKYTKQPKAEIKQEINNQCFTPPSMMSVVESAMDFGIILESDGESLQLSEPCLSPLEQQIKFNPSSLELGLLLESDGESLELSEPCLSPLSHLDSLNPFSDLLPAGFTDQSIDIFLS